MMTYATLFIAGLLGWSGPAEAETDAAPPPDGATPDKTGKLPASTLEAHEATPPASDASPPTEDPDAEATAPPPTTAGASEGETPEAYSPFDTSAEGEDDEEAPRSTTTDSPLTTPSPTPTSVGVKKTQRRRKPDRPIRWRLDFLLGYDSNRIWKKNFLSFSDDRQMHGFDVGARFDWRITDRFFLGGGATYSRFTEDRTIYGDRFTTDMVLHEPLVHARASVMAIEGIDVYGDLAAGPTISKNTITTVLASADERTQVTGGFSIVGGLALYLPKSWLANKGASRATAGLDVGLGYQYRGDIEIATDLSLDEDPLATDTLSYGNVAFRGMVFRTGLFVRFL